MNRIRQIVLTIHGVNPIRTWQRVVGRVLEPHFRHVPIEYDEYLGLKGCIKPVFSPWCVLLVFAGFSFAVILTLRGDPGSALACVVGTLTSFALGLIIAAKQRIQCLDRVKPKLIAASQGDPVPPHVIAHSFGTYLIGTALRKFPEVMVDRLVLVGSILPRRYNWTRVLSEKPAPFTVRNEVGSCDFVVRLAGFAKCFACDIGNAGFKGFVVTEGVVHDDKSPWGSCAECVNPADVVSVHNVPLGEFGHSTHFLGPGHARSLWLQAPV